MVGLYRALLRLEAILAALFLILMVALIFLGGVARMMHTPFNWTIDFATCFFAWACFLCADIAWRNNALMSIDLVTSRVSEKIQKALTYCNYLLIAGFLIYLIYTGIILAYLSRARSFQGIPEISYSWVTMSLPVGSALLLVTTLLKVAGSLRQDGYLRPRRA